MQIVSLKTEKAIQEISYETFPNQINYPPKFIENLKTKQNTNGNFLGLS